ncbi:SDR family NAD(P)-dependent oxidoreductase [Aggregatilinea lenta]|uniref:SDR family NAD(P)-dependent oxidoreductase n=1 Tax=Aggregatilinea lenta TaxID=913108 RepID=UPI000E5B2FF4|nr:SDR family NAD(P)-dependent oxidoreductase [Aggregatilinea lenta]
MRFQEKVVAITGAAKGIGRAAALAFAREGAAVAIVDRSADGEAVARELEGAGHPVLFVATDISSESEVQALFDRIAAQWNRLDVLVNNAGIYRQGDVLEAPTDEWERILAVNLTGSFLCTKYAVPLMLRGEGGVVVNVASEAGLVGIAGQVAYNVSKAGMIALTRSCAVDLASRGIRVNSVCPGTTSTPLVEEAIRRAPDPAAAKRFLEESRPMNRLGTPEEIASAILYLASADAGYATGSILSIDGGYTAQ